MIVYISAMALSMIFATALAKTNGTAATSGKALFTKKLLTFLAFLPLTVVASIRHEVGTDWPIYYHHFFSINEGGKVFDEWGYNLLNRIVYQFTDNYAVMVAVVTTASCIFFYKAIFDQSENYAVSILFFVLTATYFTMINQQRQLLAMSIFLFAFRHIREKKFLPYLLLSLLAMAFHKSAVIMIPIYFLYRVHINIRTQILLLIVSLALWQPLNQLAVFVASKTSYAWYIGSIYDQNDFYLLGYIYSLTTLLIYYFFYYCGGDQDDKDYNMSLKMMWLSVIVLMFSRSIPQISRVSVYFSSIIFLTIPSMLLREKNHVRRLVYLLLLIVFWGAKLIYDVYFNHWYDVIPYQTFFQ